jgi:hypothetical protein
VASSSCRLFSRRGASGGSIGVGECPAEAGEFAGDGDRDDRAALPALSVQSLPDAVQSALRLPGDLDDVRWLPLLAAAEGLPLRGRATLVPRRFDEQPAGVPRSGLGDRTLPAFLAAGVF